MSFSNEQVLPLNLRLVLNSSDNWLNENSERFIGAEAQSRFKFEKFHDEQSGQDYLVSCVLKDLQKVLSVADYKFLFKLVHYISLQLFPRSRPSRTTLIKSLLGGA